MKLRNLSDSICVVTGASSGFGAAAARQLVAEGARVVLVARSTDKIEQLAGELGDRAEAFTADVSDAGDVARLFDHVGARYGAVDLLFNNAGVGYYAPFAQSDSRHWQEEIGANVFGVLGCTQAAIPLMKGRVAPMISVVSSMAGRRGIPGWAVYSATKFAVVGFCDALRKELAPQGIRVSLIEPGAAYTNWGYDMAADAMKKSRDAMDALRAEDVAQALVYAFAQPARTNPAEILLLPTRQLEP